MPSPTKIRQLSEFESFFVDFNVNVVTICHFTGKLTPIVLEEAINTEIKRHPLLSSCIRQDDAYYFEKAPKTHFNLRVTENTTHLPIEQFISSALNTKLPIETKLCQFMFIVEGKVDSISEDTQSTLVSIIHHSVGDGISCLEFHKNLVQLCSDKMKHMSSQEKPVLPVMQAIEEYCPKSFTADEISDFINEYRLKVENTAPKIIEPRKVDKDKTLTINVVQKRLTQTQTIKLIKRCKEKSVSVHGLICAAHLIAVKNIIDKKSNKIPICFHSPIDVRSRLKPTLSKEHMFAAAIGCTSCYDVTLNKSIWELGKEIESTVKKYIKSNDIYRGLLTFSETRSTFKIPCALSVTNIGKVNIPESEADLKLGNIYFIPSYTLPMLCVAVVTYNNQLSMTYPFTEPFFTKDQIEELKNNTFDELLHEIEC